MIEPPILIYREGEAPPDDPVLLFVSDAEVSVPLDDRGTPSGADEAAFNVSLSASPSEAVTVTYRVAPAAESQLVDANELVGSLTFQPGGPLQQTVRVAVLPDRSIVDADPPPFYPAASFDAPDTLAEAQDFVANPLVADYAGLSDLAYARPGTPSVEGYDLRERISGDFAADVRVANKDVSLEVTGVSGPATVADGSGVGTIRDFVVAMRGTDTGSLFYLVANLISDAGFIPEIGTAILASFVQRLETVIDGLRAEFPLADIDLTGHSLGGGVAQIVGRNTGLDTVTFNAPEIAPSIFRFLPPTEAGLDTVPQYSNIVNIRSGTDIVSALPLGDHLGAEIVVEGVTGTSFFDLSGHSITPLAAELRSGATVWGLSTNDGRPPLLAPEADNVFFF
ncbi:hypothetical protein ACFQU2_03835 [Siccirubricoccus deserti]